MGLFSFLRTGAYNAIDGNFYNRFDYGFWWGATGRNINTAMAYVRTSSSYPHGDGFAIRYIATVER